jgi:hypothetical protein
MHQYSYDPDRYGGAKKALKERNKVAKDLKSQGFKVRGWALRGQQRGYSGLGSSRDMSERTVYMLNVYDK